MSYVGNNKVGSSDKDTIKIKIYVEKRMIEKMDFEIEKKELVEYLCSLRREPINDELAIKMAENLIEIYPEKVEGKKILCVVLSLLGHIDFQTGFYNSAAKRADRAIKLYVEENLRQAESELLQFLISYSYIDLGKCAEKTGDYEKALEYYHHVDRDIVPYVQTCIIDIYKDDMVRYGGTIETELEQLEQVILDEEKIWDIQCAETFRLLKYLYENVKEGQEKLELYTEKSRHYNEKVGFEQMMMSDDPDLDCYVGKAVALLKKEME